MHYSVWAVYVLSLWYASVCVLFTLSSGDVSWRMKHCNCHDWLSDQFNRHFIIQGEKHSKPFPPPLSLPCSLTPLFFCLSLSFSLALALQSSLRSVVDKQFEVSLKLNSILAVGGAGEERSRDSSSGLCVGECVCVCVVCVVCVCVCVCVCVQPAGWAIDVIVLWHWLFPPAEAPLCSCT